MPCLTSSSKFEINLTRITRTQTSVLSLFSKILSGRYCRLRRVLFTWPADSIFVLISSKNKKNKKRKLAFYFRYVLLKDVKGHEKLIARNYCSKGTGYPLIHSKIWPFYRSKLFLPLCYNRPDYHLAEMSKNRSIFIRFAHIEVHNFKLSLNDSRYKTEMVKI